MSTLTAIFLISATLLFVYMSFAFFVAKWRNRLDTVDIAWGPAFVIVAWVSEIMQPSSRSLVIALLVSIWAIRLASHILDRARSHGEDPRYTELTKKWKGRKWPNAYSRIFLVQGFFVWVIALPVMMASRTGITGLKALLWIGVAVWLVGFVCEMTADRQLAAYVRQEKRPKVLQTGLWHYSRHPNYFGELLQWWGIGIVAAQASFGYIGLIGPLILTLLIIFVSGIPPIEKRRARDPEYREYQKRTSPLVLLPPRKR